MRGLVGVFTIILGLLSIVSLLTDSGFPYNVRKLGGPSYRTFISIKFLLRTPAKLRDWGKGAVKYRLEIRSRRPRIIFTLELDFSRRKWHYLLSNVSFGSCT